MLTAIFVRSVFVRSVFVSLLLGGFASAGQRPNVLLITIDDLRPELGCYGARHVKTPCIDQFAAEGVLFERAYCQQAVCNPSRTSLMTGLRPDSIGVTGNHVHFRDSHPDTVTLPQFFMNHGYHTQSIGKIYHGVFPDGASATKWDTMGDPPSWSVPTTRYGPRYYFTESGIEQAKRAYLSMYRPKNPGPDDWTEKLVFGPMTEAPDVPDSQLYDGKVADSAVQTLRKLGQQPDQPFFLAVGFIKPHTPFVAPKKYFDLYEETEISLAEYTELPEGAPRMAGHGSPEVRRYIDQPKKGAFGDANRRRLRHAYYACTSFVDAQVGRVLDELKRQQLDKNTIVVLLSDHGWHLGEHGLWGKTTNFELDTRVPLIVQTPGMKSKGQRAQSLTELVDLYPTLLELAGLPPCEILEGSSFAAVLENPSKQISTSAFSQYPRGGNADLGGKAMGYSMRTDRWRYTEWIERSSGEIVARELYDHSKDSEETINLASRSEHKQLVAQLSRDLVGAGGPNIDETNPLAQKRSLSTQFAQGGENDTSPNGAGIQREKEVVKIACIGDSITFGAGIQDRKHRSYPARLQQILGKGYKVRNFGRSGADVLDSNNGPYAKTKEHLEALDFEPELVICNLGINDHALLEDAQSAFVRDYVNLLEQYASLRSAPKIALWTDLAPVLPGQANYHQCVKLRSTYSLLLKEVAKQVSGLGMDMHTPLAGHPDWFPDHLHPNAQGALRIAEVTADAIAPNRSRVSLAALKTSASSAVAGGFEEAVAGELREAATPLGDWTAQAGHAEIDDRHAHSGRQCLHLLGGAKRHVEFTPKNAGIKAAVLSFWAERWTKREPFEFRVDQFVEDEWVAIYNGDKVIRVGGFLTQVDIPLKSATASRFRLRSTSPRNSGVLIDDVEIKQAKPMQVSKVAADQPILPALVGTELSAICRIRVDVEGNVGRAPLVESLSLTPKGTTDLADVEQVEVFYTGKQALPSASGNANAFAQAVSFGKTQSPNDTLHFRGQQELEPGPNYFWVAFRLGKNANLDHRLRAEPLTITFAGSAPQQIQTSIPAAGQRMGYALRRRGEDGVHTFRIPGLATTNKGTLIGVYDVRRRGGGDLPGDIDVGMSRSTDGGHSWEPMKIIMDMGSDPQWNYDGIGDPTVLVDRKTNTVWVAATWSHGNRSWRGSGPGMKPKETGQFMLSRSDDDGQTWSAPINITEQVKKPEWCFLLQGPGKGFTMRDGTLVLPAQFQDTPENNRLPRSTFIYSRDHGKSWKCATGAFDDTTESQVVELDSGELMINCRYNREPRRVVMTSRDMGATWSTHPSSRKALIEPGACMASLINVNHELGKNSGSLLLFSNPNSPHGRQRITIKASNDSGISWPEKFQVLLDEAPGAGYSCMSMIDNDTVGILYEGSQAHMTFQRVKLNATYRRVQKVVPE